MAALNALGPLEYDDVFDGGDDRCVYSANSPEQGFHTLSIFADVFSLEELRDVFVGGSDHPVGGHDAYWHAGTLYVDLQGGVLAVSPSLDDADVDPGTDELGLALMVAELYAAAENEA